jgi:hypothetical protein
MRSMTAALMRSVEFLSKSRAIGPRIGRTCSKTQPELRWQRTRLNESLAESQKLKPIDKKKGVVQDHASG